MQNKKKPMDIVDDFIFNNFSQMYMRKKAYDSTFKEPLSLCEDFIRISKSVNDLMFLKKKDRLNIIYILVIFVFLFLVKNGYYLEAKFFVFKFCTSLFGKSSDIFFYRVILKNSNQIKSRTLFKFLKKNFLLSARSPVKQKFTHFLENGDIFVFYKNLKTILYVNKELIKKKRVDTYLTLNPILKKKQKLITSNVFEKSIKILEKSSLDPGKKKMFKHPKFIKFIKIKSKYPNQINCANLSSDETTLVIGNQDSSIYVFDLGKKNIRRKTFELKGHDSSVFCVKKIDPGNYVLSASCTGELYLWNLKQKHLVFKYQAINQSIWDLSLTPNRKNFVSAGSGGIACFWDFERPFPIKFLNEHDSDINIIKWHSDFNFLATGSDDNTVLLWDIRLKKSIGKIEFDGAVKGIDFSGNGHRLTISGNSNFITTIDMKTMKTCFKINEKYVKRKIDTLAYINQRDFCYVKDMGILKIWTEANSKNMLPERQHSVPFKITSPFKRIFQVKAGNRQKMILIGES